jgi:hypothetical protein
MKDLTDIELLNLVGYANGWTDVVEGRRDPGCFWYSDKNDITPNMRCRKGYYDPLVNPTLAFDLAYRHKLVVDFNKPNVEAICRDIVTTVVGRYLQSLQKTA